MARGVAGRRAGGYNRDRNRRNQRDTLGDDGAALGLELGAKLPTAATRLGAYEPGSGRGQKGWSASFSAPVSAQWGVTTELSGTRRGGQAHTARLPLAAAYSPTKRLPIDWGVARGLTSASQDCSLFSGIVLPLARLW